MDATTQSKIQYLPTTALEPHPDNRPLGINEEKVEQLAAMMAANGYDESKPIKARPNGRPGTFQIIEGEHRWRAAGKAGIESLPVFVKEMSDEEALVELVAGNVQTDSHKLDFGYAAIKVCNQHSKIGYSYAVFADKVGMSKTALSEAVKGALVRKHIEQCSTGRTLLNDSTKLYTVGQCGVSDWLWFHDLIVSKSLSKADAIEISKRIRAIDKAANHSAFVFSLTELKQRIATAKERQYNETLSLIEAIEGCAEKLPDSADLFRYNFTDKTIQQYTYQAKESFLSTVANIKDITRPDVFRAYDNALKTIQQQTKDNAEKDKAHYEDEANREAADERAKAEWEAFMPEPGKWYELGPHRLYCGDNRDQAFLDGLPEKAAFAFADPPYNAGVDEWDYGFTWQQDYLQDAADFVFVTPGTNAIKDLMMNTDMQYRWALYCWIKNGMTKGALGFNNTVFIAVFSKLESVFKNMGDHFDITIKTSETEDTLHEGRKPYDLLRYVLNKFSSIGDDVIDPFLGSGTTLLMSEELGRVCYGAEINPAYCKEIISRFKQMAEK